MFASLNSPKLGFVNVMLTYYFTFTVSEGVFRFKLKRKLSTLILRRNIFGLVIAQKVISHFKNYLSINRWIC
jgi:hypothetical protein